MTFRPCPKPVKTEKKKPKRINPVSKKRAAQLREYSRRAGPWKLEHPICRIRHEGCTAQTTDIHHGKGRRGALLLDERYWIETCRSCHTWAGEDSKGAKEAGASYSILTNVDKIETDE